MYLIVIIYIDMRICVNKTVLSKKKYQLLEIIPNNWSETILYLSLFRLSTKGSQSKEGQAYSYIS